MGRRDLLKRFIFCFNESFTATKTKPKPMIIDVLVENHFVHVGCGVTREHECRLTLRLLDPKMAAKYGSTVEVDSRALFNSLRNGDIVSLRFIENPNYRPSSTESQRLLYDANY